jgi:hypothetical protein
MKVNTIVGGVLFLAGAAGAAYGFKTVAESTPNGPHPEFWEKGFDLKDLNGPVFNTDRKPTGPMSGTSGSLQGLTFEAELYRWGPVGLAVIGLVIALV